MFLNFFPELKEKKEMDKEERKMDKRSVVKAITYVSFSGNQLLIHMDWWLEQIATCKTDHKNQIKRPAETNTKRTLISMIFS